MAAVAAVLALITVAVAQPASAGAPPPPGGSFVDDDANTHEGMIEAIAALGVTLGCETSLYCPAAELNRGQMASFLARALTLPDPVADHFADDDGTTHEDNINRISEAGITTGFSDGTYRPDDIITRAQMASFIARGFGLDAVATGPFVDVSGIHAGNINAIYVAGITTGCALGVTYFCPDDAVRRDQMASFIGRALGLTPVAVAARDWTLAISAVDADGVPVGIHAVDANTGAVDVLTTDVDDRPHWNRDKTRIAFHRLFAELFDDPLLGEDFVPPVHVVEADASAELDVGSWLVTEGEAAGSFGYSFGPGGDLAIDAGVSFAGVDRDLWIADIDGAAASELAADPGWWLTDPQWSTGGDSIAVYAGDGTGMEAVRIVNATTGATVLDIDEPANFFEFPWSPTGEIILVHLASSATQNELLLYDVSFMDGIPVFLPPGNLSGFAWSPDGTHVAFVSDADGDREVYVVEIASELVTQLTFTDTVDEADPVWSPDGVMLAFGELGGTTVHIVVAETGTEVTALTDATDPDW